MIFLGAMAFMLTIFIACAPQQDEDQILLFAEYMCQLEMLEERRMAGEDVFDEMTDLYSKMEVLGDEIEVWIEEQGLDDYEVGQLLEEAYKQTPCYDGTW